MTVTKYVLATKLTIDSLKRSYYGGPKRVLADPRKADFPLVSSVDQAIKFDTVAEAEEFRKGLVGDYDVMPVEVTS